MAGYMTKLNGHVYEGGHAAGEALHNGEFVQLNASGEVVKTAAAKDMVFRIAEKTALWGMPAVVLNVTAVGGDEVFFVEAEWDVYSHTMYDETKYTTEPGTLVRMHRPLVGEQLIMTVEQALYDTLTEGQTVKPAAGGSVA